MAEPSPAPNWICRHCGKPVGLLGNWLAKIVGVGIHGCDFSRWSCAAVTRDDQPSVPPPSKLTWRVGEAGNTVVVEFGCHDNYEAIELSEIISLGLREGHLEIEVANDG